MEHGGDIKTMKYSSQIPKPVFEPRLTWNNSGKQHLTTTSLAGNPS